jgi:uracil-DNA glycosylase family 4
MAGELERLAAEAAACTRCRLYETRTQVVFGEGNPSAELMFVGEAPGYHEDRQGRPFVGPSGQLLNRLLAGIALRREDVYICNVLKSRPPRNRDPLPDEIAACRYWLDAQVRLVDPKVVVTLGNFAAKTLLETTTGITRLRGRTHPFQGRVLLPTFHPAAALHASGRVGPSPLDGMEEDFRLLAKLLAERRPAPSERPAAPGGTPAGSGPAAGTGPPGAGREVPPGEPPDSEQLGLF